MKISILQMPIEEGNIEHNLDTMAAMLDKAVNSDQRPDAVLLPELWNTGFYPKPISEYADSQDIWKKHMQAGLRIHCQHHRRLHRRGTEGQNLQYLLCL